MLALLVALFQTSKAAIATTTPQSAYLVLSKCMKAEYDMAFVHVATIVRAERSSKP